MSNWTTRATVQKHLITDTTALDAVENERLYLTGENDHQLTHRNISDFELKSIESVIPTVNGGVTLTGTAWSSLANTDIVEGTVVVASTTTLDVVYTEGNDYIIAYDLGRIKRTSDSDIGSGSTVYVFYVKFNVFTVDTDYTINTSTGIVARVATGDIREYQILFADYTITVGTVDEDLIDQCILEAEDIIEQKLSEDYSTSSTDQGLKTGATHLAISLICKSKSAETMLKLPTDEADGVARSWMKLKDEYEGTAYDVLSRFFAGPARSTMRVGVTVPSSGSGASE